MSNPDNNRSSAVSPEAQGAINDAAKLAVQTAVETALAGVFAGMKPTFDAMAALPASLRDINKPFVDPAKAAREARESKKSKADEAEIARINKARREACAHLDKNGRPAINLVHNFPDHQPRGICVICHDWIHPKEWRIGAPTEAEPRGRAYCVEPHKDYRIVLQIEAMN